MVILYRAMLTPPGLQEKQAKEGSWEFEFEFPKKFAALMIEKGSVSVKRHQPDRF